MTGAIIFKEAGTKFFEWLVQNGYFNIIKICVGVHDEFNIEFPEHLEKEAVSHIQMYMENTASKYCTTLPIPAVPEVANCWVH